MQINPKLIKNQFEKSFDIYNENAVVQKIMAEKLVNELSDFKSRFNNVYELGCGTGLLTEELVKNINFSSYFANDLIEASKQCISKIIPDAVFYCGNAQKIKPVKKMDLIVSNAMFQWFKDLKKISQHCKTMLNTQGILAFTTFSTNNFKEIKELTGLSLEYYSLDDMLKILKEDYEILYSREFEHVLTFSNPLELLAHMKNTGVNSLTAQYWSFKEVKGFCDAYKNSYPEISLTYSPVIIICQKY